MLASRAVLLEQFNKLHKAVLKIVRQDEVCRRFMTTPSVGAIVTIIYKSALDDPGRIKKSRNAGPLFGLTPKRYQSGETDITGGISRVGDEMVRTALYEATNVLLSRVTRFSALKRWKCCNRCPIGQDLSGKRGTSHDRRHLLKPGVCRAGRRLTSPGPLEKQPSYRLTLRCGPVPTAPARFPLSAISGLTRCKRRLIGEIVRSQYHSCTELRRKNAPISYRSLWCGSVAADSRRRIRYRQAGAGE